MLCLLPRYLLFRFNIAASGTRIPKIFNHKRLLTGYLMAVSSNLIKEIFDAIHCLVIRSRLIVEANVVLIYMTPGKWIDDGGRVIRNYLNTGSPKSELVHA